MRNIVTDKSGSLVWGPAVLAASHKRGPTATARLTAEASSEPPLPLLPRLFSPKIHSGTGARSSSGSCCLVTTDSSRFRGWLVDTVVVEFTSFTRLAAMSP